jgi:hypothetical protein
VVVMAVEVIVMVRFQVLAAVSVKRTALWDIAPCSLVEVGLLPRDYAALRPRKLSS